MFPRTQRPADLLSPKAYALKKEGKCPTCGQHIGELKNQVSLLEYRISGLCQKCQDSVFSNGDPDDYNQEN